MEFLRWLLNNFGFFFGGLFLLYLFLMIRRLVILYDFLRSVPSGEENAPIPVGKADSLSFLESIFERLSNAVAGKTGGADAVIDAVWAEVECRISVHFTALHGYVNTLILIGFAGTIFGSIGAFNEMFTGLARGQAAATVFVASWNHGLATALYTSLGAAAIGGTVVTLICSRFLMSRAKRLETMVGLRISEIIEEETRNGEETTKAVAVPG
jgi:hypothetical protein